MSMRPQLKTLLRTLALAGAAAFAVPAHAAEEVSLYTTREPKLIQPLLDAFTKESGIKVNTCLLYTSPSPRDQRGSRMPSSA